MGKHSGSVRIWLATIVGPACYATTVANAESLWWSATAAVAVSAVAAARTVLGSGMEPASSGATIEPRCLWHVVATAGTITVVLGLWRLLLASEVIRDKSRYIKPFYS